MKKLGQLLDGIVKIGVCDADEAQNKSLASRFGIQGFPTLKLFVNGKPSDYQGARTAAAMKDAVIKAISQAAGGSSESDSSSSKKSESNSNSGGSGVEIEVTDDDFEKVL